MVSRDIACWVGYTYNHLSRFKKVQRQVTQRAAQKAKINNKRRLHVKEAETTAPSSTVTPPGTAGKPCSKSSGTPTLKASWAIGSYGSSSDKTEQSETVSTRDGNGAGGRPALPVTVATSGPVEAAAATTTVREESGTNTDVDEREDVPLLGVISPLSEEDEEEVGEEREGWADAKRARSGKLLSHARRAIFQAEELLKTGSITFPLKRSHVEEIRRLKVMGIVAA